MDNHIFTASGESGKPIDLGKPVEAAQGARDRRQVQRPRRLMVCKILIGTVGKGVIDCMLLDMSESGARLETATMTPLPERFELRLPDGTTRPVSRRWATGKLIGVRFED